MAFRTVALRVLPVCYGPALAMCLTHGHDATVVQQQLTKNSEKHAQEEEKRGSGGGADVAARMNQSRRCSEGGEGSWKLKIYGKVKNTRHTMYQYEDFWEPKSKPS